MKKSILSLLLLSAYGYLHAQQTKAKSPYKVNYPIIGTIVGVGAGVSAYGLYRIYTKPGLTTEQVMALDAGDINHLDRPSTNFYSHDALIANRALTITSLSLPILLLAIDKDVRQDAGTVSLMYMEALSVSHIVYTMTAGFANRNRPYTYNDDAPMDTRRGTHGRSSFYAHLPMLASVSSVFAAKVFTDFHPDTRFKPLIWTTAGTVIVGSNLLSYFAGDAYPTDLLVSTVLGVAAGYLVPYFKIKLAEKKNGGVNPYYKY